ncbi:hypothetical protein DL96DRAFT_1676342 [Flagelloscypha sp. PMI_526]|nr:hypothetical protein DL96DRAFT_1676342 [Flagelloscypha sp. PMI_526]
MGDEILEFESYRCSLIEPIQAHFHIFPITAAMSMSGALSSPGKGLRFLSFGTCFPTWFLCHFNIQSLDGGGIEAVSQALMVREIMSRIGADCQLSSPARACDYFDMICGSGFGGLLAIMCGILKMTGDELVHEIVNLCKAVFSEGLDTNQRTSTTLAKSPYQNTSHPRLFRNYHSRANSSVDCLLWEAGRATTAMLDLFSPIVIGEAPVGETMVGGGLRWNNPTDELTKEAAQVFKDRCIASIINIGSGHPGHISLSGGLADLFPRIALDCERVADDMERRFGRAPEAFCRLNVEQGLQHLAVDLSNLHALVSHTRSYLQGAQMTRNIDALLHDLIYRPERIPVDGISGVAPVVTEVLDTVCPKICPPPTQYFTGRSADLQKLDEYFTVCRSPCRIAVLYGIGGGGKSQTGLEFIRRSQGRFTDVFFIDASDKFTLENDLKAIASGVADKPTVNDALNLLRRTKAEWLLFFDNADDPTLNLRPYIMWSHGNVLITTRNREMRMHAPDCNIWVDKLELDDAKQLLLRGVAVERNSETDMIASEIVQKLGCLALAVNQARGFLSQDIVTLSEYLSIYTQNCRQLLEEGSIQTTDDYEHTVYTTWTISFNKLSPAAAFLIELLCFMHHDAIPSRIFEDAWKNDDRKDDGVVPTRLTTFLSTFGAPDSSWNIFDFGLLIKEILSFSLIEFNATNRTFSLHPLVQQWAQSQCHHLEETICSTQTLLSLAGPTADSKEQYTVAISLLPHLRASAQYGLKVHFTLLHCVGYIYYFGGMFRECSQVREQVVSEMQEHLGLKHRSTLACMSNLAAAYIALGQYRDAIKLEEQVLVLSTQVLGKEDPDTLTTMGNLAGAYSALGQHRNALKLNEETLALRIHIMGEEHPDTLATMNNLARAYSGLHQARDALELYERVLALMTQILGEEHPHTLTSMNNVATAYLNLGRHKDALKLQEHALALQTQILGEKHPKTLLCMSNLTFTYSALLQHKEALKMKEQVLALRVQVLGETHPDTLTSMSYVATSYEDLGQCKDARELQEKVLALRKEISGEEHPDTLASMKDLALQYSAHNRHKDARELQERVLTLSTRIMGGEHLYTLNCMRDLALTYSALGRLRDAQELQEKDLALTFSLLGDEHPATLASMSSLARTYSDLGELQNALRLHEQALNFQVGCQGEGESEAELLENLLKTF